MVKLAEFAMLQPQACYAGFTFGLWHRWTHFLRTLPDIEDLLEPLEHTIADVLIPSTWTIIAQCQVKGTSWHCQLDWNYKSKPGCRSTVASVNEDHSATS